MCTNCYFGTKMSKPAKNLLCNFYLGMLPAHFNTKKKHTIGLQLCRLFLFFVSILLRWGKLKWIYVCVCAKRFEKSMSAHVWTKQRRKKNNQPRRNVNKRQRVKQRTRWKREMSAAQSSKKKTHTQTDGREQKATNIQLYFSLSTDIYRVWMRDNTIKCNVSHP